MEFEAGIETISIKNSITAVDFSDWAVSSSIVDLIDVLKDLRIS